MRLALTLPLIVLGLMLLGTSALPLGLLLIWMGVRFYERPGGHGGEGLITLLMIFGGLGALAVVIQFIWERTAA